MPPRLRQAAVTSSNATKVTIYNCRILNIINDLPATFACDMSLTYDWMVLTNGKNIHSAINKKLMLVKGEDNVARVTLEVTG